MNSTRRSLAAFVICAFSLICVSIATAQQRDSTTTQSPVPIVTATASTERVRYVSIGAAYQTRLQVFSASGAQAYDSGLRLGNLVDWQLQDQQGQRLGNGSYLFVVTVTDFSSHLIQKYGSVVLEEGQVYLEQSSLLDLSPAQGAILKASKQAENLTPIDRIGAAGLNRAASTDTTSTTNDGGTQSGGTTSSASAPVDPPPSAVSGTGTAGKLVKWQDNAGALINANLFEDASGNIGLGTTNLSDVLLAGNDKFKIVDGAMTFSFRDFSSGQGYFAVGSSTNGIKGFVGHTNSNDGFTMGTFSNHKLTLRTNSINRLTIDTLGNVGIGTTTPTAGIKLDVIGAARIDPTGIADKGKIQFGTPNAETGMSIIYPATGRADLRFNGSTLKLVAGEDSGPPPATNGIVIRKEGAVGIGVENPSLGKLQVFNDSTAIYATSSAGTAIAATSPTVAFAASGNAIQSLNKGGWVKAMIEYDSEGNVIRCYNSQNNSSTPPCDFIQLGRPGDIDNNGVMEFYHIIAPFTAEGRFVSITTTRAAGGVRTGVNYEIDGSFIEVYTFVSSTGAAQRTGFTLIIY